MKYRMSLSETKYVCLAAWGCRYRQSPTTVEQVKAVKEDKRRICESKELEKQAIVTEKELTLCLFKTLQFDVLKH